MMRRPAGLRREQEAKICVPAEVQNHQWEQCVNSLALLKANSWDSER
jgi:hypothetical protein